MSKEQIEPINKYIEKSITMKDAEEFRNLNSKHSLNETMVQYAKIWASVTYLKGLYDGIDLCQKDQQSSVN